MLQGDIVFPGLGASLTFLVISQSFRVPFTPTGCVGKHRRAPCPAHLGRRVDEKPRLLAACSSDPSVSLQSLPVDDKESINESHGGWEPASW